MLRKNGENQENLKKNFPAIFFRDGDGIGVKFPDLEGCLTCADNYQEAMKNAEEALGGWILSQEDMNAQIPEPTPFENIKTGLGEAVVMVSAYPEMLKVAV